ncbi:shikimate 5-dehydrogenase [Pasteurella canis]|uniref:shikimate 5-dehydrogenase n=1 Tax=Pasteurella canis TaxID=753 RepID=UPI001CC5F713|nr:shikimate 5-dehydrogenase [Pasteurella canis]UAY77462.1 shikimate 5-dehydrogenase [Pasteurella canis]
MINKDTKLCISLAGRPGNFGTRFHNYLYEKLALNYIYKAFTTADIEHAIKGVRALEIRGCAVSMPFKESCMPFIDEISESAQAIQSVNTIVNENGYLKAYNTDYIAIIKLIEKYQLSPQAHVLVQGSGGMAKAVVAAFKHKGFEHVSIYSRNEITGKMLASLYGYQYLDQLVNQVADILVNATPIGMEGGKEVNELAFPAFIIEQAKVVFDVVASPEQTPLIQYATQQGKHTISGAEVIVLQAVEQFELYTQQRPNEHLIKEAAEFARQLV